MADGDVAEGPVQDVSFTDPDAYVRAHKIRDSEYVRLANLPFEARLIHFDLGAFRIRFARFSPPIGEADPRRISAIVRAFSSSVLISESAVRGIAASLRESTRPGLYIDRSGGWNPGPLVP